MTVEHHIEKLTWTEVDARIAAGVDVVLLPIGTTEQHGPHMPLGTDTIIADGHVAAAVARLSDEKSLKRCLETLEPVRRNAVVLAFVQGLSHGEVAGRLGVPLGTCKAWIRRSLLALRECMG